MHAQVVISTHAQVVISLRPRLTHFLVAAGTVISELGENVSSVEGLDNPKPVGRSDKTIGSFSEIIRSAAVKRLGEASGARKEFAPILLAVIEKLSEPSVLNCDSKQAEKVLEKVDSALSALNNGGVDLRAFINVNERFAKVVDPTSILTVFGCFATALMKNKQRRSANGNKADAEELAGIFAELVSEIWCPKGRLINSKLNKTTKDKTIANEFPSSKSAVEDLYSLKRKEALDDAMKKLNDHFATRLIAKAVEGVEGEIKATVASIETLIAEFDDKRFGYISFNCPNSSCDGLWARSTRLKTFLVEASEVNLPDVKPQELRLLRQLDVILDGMIRQADAASSLLSHRPESLKAGQGSEDARVAMENLQFLIDYEHAPFEKYSNLGNSINNIVTYLGEVRKSRKEDLSNEEEWIKKLLKALNGLRDASVKFSGQRKSKVFVAPQLTPVGVWAQAHKLWELTQSVDQLLFYLQVIVEVGTVKAGLSPRNPRKEMPEELVAKLKALTKASKRLVKVQEFAKEVVEANQLNQEKFKKFQHLVNEMSNETDAGVVDGAHLIAQLFDPKGSSYCCPESKWSKNMTFAKLKKICVGLDIKPESIKTDAWTYAHHPFTIDPRFSTFQFGRSDKIKQVLGKLKLAFDNLSNFDYKRYEEDACTILEKVESIKTEIDKKERTVTRMIETAKKSHGTASAKTQLQDLHRYAKKFLELNRDDLESGYGSDLESALESGSGSDTDGGSDSVTDQRETGFNDKLGEKNSDDFYDFVVKLLQKGSFLP